MMSYEQEEMHEWNMLQDADDYIAKHGVKSLLDNLSRISRVSIIAYLRQTAKDNDVTANQGII